VNSVKSCFSLAPVILAALVFAGCSTTSKTGDTADRHFAAPDHLTAYYTNGDAVLHWQNHATADGGNWVEFSTPGSEYTKLDIYLAEENGTNFVHPSIAPQTQFIYHILPFFGQATEAASVTTGPASTNTTDLEEGPLPETNTVKTASTLSIRSAATFADAAPSGLTATLSSPTSVDLRWTDRASDEDGFLVEASLQPKGPFKVCALLPADTVSFRKIQLPAETTCYFRVRCFFYGKPSETASVITP